MTIEPNTQYDNFAWFYNKYWSARLIEQIYWSIEKHFLSKIPKGGSILDICCGNGHLSARMAQAGFRITGIDGSDSMLLYARQNAPEGAFSQADAREFAFDQQFDGAISTCDSFNHIMTAEELQKAFHNAYSALKPGGWFSFDLNTVEGYHKYWTGEKHGHWQDDNAFIIRLTFDDAKLQSAFEAIMFRLVDGQWHRFDALLTQQFYPIEAVLDLLNKVGFKNIEHFDTEKDFGIDGSGRIMYIMQK